MRTCGWILLALLVGLCSYPACALPTIIQARMLPAVPDALEYRKGEYLVPIIPLARIIGVSIQETVNGDTVIAQYRGKTVTISLHPGVAFPHRIAGVIYGELQPFIEGLGGSVSIDDTAGTASITLPKATPVTLAVFQTGRDIFNSIDKDQEVYTLHFDGSNLCRQTYLEGCNTEFARFFPDGQVILYYRRGDLMIRDLTHVFEAPLARNDDGKYAVWLEPSISPDGKSVVWAKASKEIVQVSVVDGSQKVLYTGRYVGSPCYSPDGKTIAFSAWGDIILMNNDGTNLRTLGEGEHPRFSPDGSLLLAFQYGLGDGKPPSWLVTYVLTGKHAGVIYQPGEEQRGRRERDGHFSPDSHSIVVERDRNIFLMRPDRSGEQQLTKEAKDTQPSFSPDGKGIYFIRDYRLCYMPLDTRIIKVLTPGLGMVTGYDLSPEKNSILLTAAPEPTWPMVP